MGEYLGKLRPCAHGFLVNKTQECYTNFFSGLKNLANFEPKWIVVDFERALINSLASSFSTAKICGCNFHWGQILWKRIQEEGLSVA